MMMVSSLGNMTSLRTLRVLRALKSVTALPGLRIICTALIEAVQRLRDVRSSAPLLHSLTASDPHYHTSTVHTYGTALTLFTGDDPHALRALHLLAHRCACVRGLLT